MEDDQTDPIRTRVKRGFAAMNPQRQKEIASMGGRAAHQSGHAHQFNSVEAREAGRKRHERQAVPAGKHPDA
jgi:general stress protein YciG